MHLLHQLSFPAGSVQKEGRWSTAAVWNSHLGPEVPAVSSTWVTKFFSKGNVKAYQVIRWRGIRGDLLSGIRVTGAFFVSLRSDLNLNCFCEDSTRLLIIVAPPTCGTIRRLVYCTVVYPQMLMHSFFTSWLNMSNRFIRTIKQRKNIHINQVDFSLHTS